MVVRGEEMELVIGGRIELICGRDWSASMASDVTQSVTRSGRVGGVPVDPDPLAQIRAKMNLFMKYYRVSDASYLIREQRENREGNSFLFCLFRPDGYFVFERRDLVILDTEFRLFSEGDIESYSDATKRTFT